MKGPKKTKDYRRTVDGVMVADIGFKKQLWALDKELDVVWDWGSGKWEIWKFPGQAKKVNKVMDHQAKHVMTIQTQDRNFRELGADILLNLQWGDTSRWSLNELCDYFDKMDDNIRRAKAKDFSNWMDSLLIENIRYFRSVKKSVPRKFEIKPSEERLLINCGKKKPSGPTIFKLRNQQKIGNCVGVGNA